MIKRNLILMISAGILLGGCGNTGVEKKVISEAEFVTEEDNADAETKEAQVKSDAESSRTTEEKSMDETAADPLTEDEILAMQDEELWDLYKEQRMDNTDRISPIRKVYGLEDIKLYPYIERFKNPSAADYEEAARIVEEYWPEVDSGGERIRRNIQMIGENDGYWIFTYEGHEQNGAMIIYKKDYFDVETSTLGRELNENYVREFCETWYCDMEDYLGEYVIKQDDEYYFRRYYLRIIRGDYGLSDQILLECRACHISPDGHMQEESQAIRSAYGNYSNVYGYLDF